MILKIQRNHIKNSHFPLSPSLVALFVQPFGATNHHKISSKHKTTPFIIIY